MDVQLLGPAVRMSVAQYLLLAIVCTWILALYANHCYVLFLEPSVDAISKLNTGNLEMEIVIFYILSLSLGIPP